MRVTISRNELLKCLVRVLPAASKKSNIPILANILLTCKDDALEITGCDMEIAIVGSAACDVARPGITTVPGYAFHDIVRRLPEDGSVLLDQEGGTSVLRMTSGRFTTEMSTLPHEGFPAMTIGDLPTKFTMASAELRMLIDHTRTAISTEITRYYLNGLYFSTAQDASGTDMLRAVATDGHRLIISDVALPPGLDPATFTNVIVHRRTIMDLRKLLDDTAPEVDIEMSETRMRFTVGPAKLTTKLVDGTFPDYARIIPKPSNNLLRVKQRHLAGGLARVSAINSDRMCPIAFELEETLTAVTCHAATRGSAREDMDSAVATYGGTAMKVGIQARYVTDVLEQIKETAEFHFSEGVSPVLVRDFDNPNYLAVLMPMRI